MTITDREACKIADHLLSKFIEHAEKNEFVQAKGRKASDYPTYRELVALRDYARAKARVEPEMVDL